MEKQLSRCFWNISTFCFSRQLNKKTKPKKLDFGWIDEYFICLSAQSNHLISEITAWKIEFRSKNEAKFTFTHTLFESRIVAKIELLLMLRKLNHGKFIICHSHFHQIEGEWKKSERSSQWKVIDVMCVFFVLFSSEEKVVQQFDVLLFKWTTIYSSIWSKLRFFVCLHKQKIHSSTWFSSWISFWTTNLHHR